MTKLTKITDTPIQPIPANAIRATKKAHVMAHSLLGERDRGVFADKLDAQLHLMTWGKCHTVETVLRHANRTFVWVGTCSDAAGEKPRDMFEEIA